MTPLLGARPRALRRALAALALAVPLVAACSGGQEPAAQDPAARADTETAPAEPVQAASRPVLRQTADEVARTSAGIRQLDDLPMYEMTFYGGYDAEAPLTEDELARKAEGWACSLYHRGTEFGRNFDWDPDPAIVVRADPPDGYASLSVVDAVYLLGKTGPANLSDPGQRRRLGHAVLAPFDGMNEKGLAVGMASTPNADLPAPMKGKPTLSSVRIMRVLLDRAATVDEAVALMRGYNIDFSGGPQVHYLIADRSGASAVVEFGKGRMNVSKDRVLTNWSVVSGTPDDRYKILSRTIDSPADGLDLLKSVAQSHTRWSVVYDLKAGTARLVTAKRWGKVHTLSIARPQG
ncbi:MULTISPECIES: linear amide C-N hydrolase [Nonomuraea]|uniref:Linear amide C-N hydrolase n=1 Tax=Nonomuraea mangrovi TaxID=2316207 RepID=A0ABW4SLR6_9ACTN